MRQSMRKVARHFFCKFLENSSLLLSVRETTDFESLFFFLYFLSWLANDESTLAQKMSNRKSGSQPGIQPRMYKVCTEEGAGGWAARQARGQARNLCRNCINSSCSSAHPRAPRPKALRTFTPSTNARTKEECTKRLRKPTLTKVQSTPQR